MKTVYYCLFFILLWNGYVSYGQHTVTIKKGDDKNFTFFKIQGDTTKFKFKAIVADYEGKFEDAAKYSLKAIEKGEYTPDKIKNGYYDIACYYSLLNKEKDAIMYLLKCIDSGYDDFDQLENESDLQKLKDSETWRTKIEPRIAAYYKVHNRPLAEMFAEDQNVRLSGQITADLAIQDSIRRDAVLKMIENGELRSGHDYYKAGMIMHHGTKTEDYKKAQELLALALKTEPIHRMAPWLNAASKDRLLLSEGKPQWYGTQGMSFSSNGKMSLDPKIIDTTLVTPEQRKELNTPSIEKIKEYIKNFNDN